MHGEIKPYLSENLLISMTYGYHSLFFDIFIFSTQKNLNDNRGRSKNNDDTNDSWVPSKKIEWKWAKRKSRSRREKITFKIHFIAQINKHNITKRKKIVYKSFSTL